MTDKIVVMSTCGSSEEAQRLARQLVAQRAAACVNIVAPVRSIYRWNGRIEDAEEWLLIVKSSRSSFDRLRTILEAAHSYELPEVLAIPVVAGSPNYLAWIEGEVPEAEVPEAEVPVAEAPEAEVPEGKMLKGEAIEGQASAAELATRAPGATEPDAR
jgi:periplasmic divalent cation tolerance protein